MGDRGGRSRPDRAVRPVLTTARSLPAVSVRLTAATVALIVVLATLPAAFAVASGSLVGSIPGAAADGWSSPAGRRLAGAVAVVVGVFVLQQVAGPALRELADALGRRAEARLRSQVMVATLLPAGVAHLEDPDVSDLVRDAESVSTGQATLSDAVVGMAMVSASSLAGVASAGVLAAYRWWLAVALLGVYAVVTRVLVGQLRTTVGALRGNTRRFRRSSYFRDLALGTAAGKELRVFGLGSWVLERFAGEWQLAMAGFWQQQRKGRWVPIICAGSVTGAQVVTHVLLARSAVAGDIDLSQLVTFAGAAAGVATVLSIGWDNLNIPTGPLRCPPPPPSSGPSPNLASPSAAPAPPTGCRPRPSRSRVSASPTRAGARPSSTGST